MSKDIFFHCGFPRSLNTVLSCVLAQDPSVFVTPTSGLCDLLQLVNHRWREIEAHRGNYSPLQQASILSGAIQGYHSTKAPIIIDKNRGWPRHLGLLDRLFGLGGGDTSDVKAIACVRDIRDVLASIELLWRNAIAHGLSPVHPDLASAMQTQGGRLEVWMGPLQIVGSSYFALIEALKQGYGDRIYLLDAKRFSYQPEQELRQIYQFLGLDEFDFDCDNVTQLVTEGDDLAYGWGEGLHTIREGPIQPLASKWEAVLGEAARPYDRFNDWRPYLERQDERFAQAARPAIAIQQQVEPADSQQDTISTNGQLTGEAIGSILLPS